MLYNRFLFQSEILYFFAMPWWSFLLPTVDLLQQAASCPVYVYDGYHLSTNFQRKIICQGCEGKTVKQKPIFTNSFVSAKKTISKKNRFRLKKFRMEMSNHLYQAQDLRLQ